MIDNGYLEIWFYDQCNIRMRVLFPFREMLCEIHDDYQMTTAIKNWHNDKNSAKDTW